MIPAEPAVIEDVARRFRLLGDATRLRLLRALADADESSVGELADRAGTSLANASKHLVQLERDGIVARHRRGTTVLYRIADPTIAAVCDLVCAGVQSRYAELAERAG